MNNNNINNNQTKYVFDTAKVDRVAPDQKISKGQ
jgi:hypothetical protein